MEDVVARRRRHPVGSGVAWARRCEYETGPGLGTERSPVPGPGPSPARPEPELGPARVLDD